MNCAWLQKTKNVKQMASSRNIWLANKSIGALKWSWTIALLSKIEYLSKY